MSEMQCSVGLFLNEDCHKQTLVRQKGIMDISDLPSDSVELLKWRCGLDCLEPAMNICFHHEKKYITRFAQFQRICCDPYKRHKGPVKSTLSEISMEMAEKLKQSCITVKPGWKLCSTCSSLLNTHEHL